MPLFATSSRSYSPPALLPNAKKRGRRSCQNAKKRGRAASDQAVKPPWLPLSIAARPPSRHTRTRAPLRDFADVRSRMATESQRQQRHAAAASHLSADSGSSVFLLRVRISYPSSSTLPHHCDSTSPGLLGVDRSSTVSAGSDPCMSGVCGLSVLETHRISRATRTANVMSLFVFCESRGGRRTTLSPIIRPEPAGAHRLVGGLGFQKNGSWDPPPQQLVLALTPPPSSCSSRCKSTLLIIH